MDKGRSLITYSFDKDSHDSREGVRLICYLRGGSRRSCSWIINISFRLSADTADVPTTVYGTVQCAIIDAQTTLVKLNIDDSPFRT